MPISHIDVSCLGLKPPAHCLPDAPIILSVRLDQENYLTIRRDGILFLNQRAIGQTDRQAYDVLADIALGQIISHAIKTVNDDLAAKMAEKGYSC